MSAVLGQVSRSLGAFEWDQHIADYGATAVVDDFPVALRAQQLRQRADRLLREEPDLREHPAGRQAILDELEKRRKALAAEVNKEIIAVEAAVHAARRRTTEWGAILAGTGGLVVVILLAFNQSSIAVFRDWRLLWYNVFLVGLAAPFLVTLFLQSLAVSWRRASVNAAESRLDQRLDIEIPALIRQIMHEWDSDERIWSSHLRSEVAPAMVELDMADTVSSATLKKLKHFIATHHTSAIGIAGTRGAGKTTLMEQLRYDPELSSLSVRIPAPVYYDAHELLRLIHTRLARSVLGEREQDRLRPRMVPRIKHLLRPLGKVTAVIFILAILISLWLFEQDKLSWQSNEDAGFHVGILSLLAICGLSVIGGVLLSKAWRALRRRSELLAEPSTVRELAIQQLEFLHWSIETQQTAKAGLDLEKFTAEREYQFSRRERDVTHAESVDLLRDFLHDLARLSSRRLVLVCIDELDKISDPKHSVDMINGIKDLFHIPGVHFVVSVSTDAMHRFAARGVPLRDVFDSSFDIIVSTRRLSLRESRLLISRRAIDFCVPAVMFCHAWSGGHARDLIRTARACVETGAASDTNIGVDHLAETILRDDVREVVDAAIEKLEAAASPDGVNKLLALREVIEGPNPFSLANVELPSVADLATSAESEALVNALTPYIRLAEMTRAFFVQSRAPSEWQADSTEVIVEQLASIRSVLATRPQEALLLLEEVAGSVVQKQLI